MEVPIRMASMSRKILEQKVLEKLVKYMSKVVEGEGPEVTFNSFEKCNNENYNLRSNCETSVAF